MHKCTHAYTHARTEAHTRTHARTYTRTHKHTNHLLLTASSPSLLSVTGVAAIWKDGIWWWYDFDYDDDKIYLWWCWWWLDADADLIILWCWWWKPRKHKPCHSQLHPVFWSPEKGSFRYFKFAQYLLISASHCRTLNIWSMLVARSLPVSPLRSFFSFKSNKHFENFYPGTLKTLKTLKNLKALKTLKSFTLRHWYSSAHLHQSLFSPSLEALSPVTKNLSCWSET